MPTASAGEEGGRGVKNMKGLKGLDDVAISRIIVEEYTKEFLAHLDCDAAVVGAGPSGLVAAQYLARGGMKVAVYERRLSVGGGMWGGGMMCGRCVFQEASLPILREAGVRVKDRGDGYYTTDSIETVACLCATAVKAGARIFNLLSAEDVMIRGARVTGVVLQWTAVEAARLHVDPLTAGARFVVDATGHAAEIANIIVRKIGKKLLTETGDLLGEKPMWAERGERTIVAHTKEIYPGVQVAGMAANAVFGGPRMGPIFGGMLKSGRKIARLIAEDLAP